VVHLDPTLFRKAFELYKKRADKVWGLIDCVSFVVMKELAINDALSADRHFEQAGFRILIKP
jgi:predicted nucleic acid-binding protein